VARSTPARKKSTPAQARAGKKPNASARGRFALLARPGVRRAVRVGGVVLVAAFVANLFLVPVSNFMEQRSVLAQKQAEFDALADANEQLQTEVNRMQTPAGVKEAARDHLGMTMPGEQRLKLLPGPALPTSLPGHWPYTIVTGILAVRQEIAAANNAPLAPLAP
jgi:cell division protein FtsB